MIKVKINKVVPFEDLRFSKSEPYVVKDKKYVPAPTRVDENYTGVNLYFLLTFTLPSLDHDYEYLKVDIRVENLQFTKLIHRDQQIFKDITKKDVQRSIIFEFVPPFKGRYSLSVDTAFRNKYFVQTSQPPPEKREHNKIDIKCQESLKVEENILSEDKSGSITFPLFLQYAIESYLPFQELSVDFLFQSQKFKFKELHTKKNAVLKKNEIYYLMYEIQPKSVKQILSQKGITIGTLKLNYGVQAVLDKKTSLKPTQKYVFFKAATLTQEVPKKDIVEVRVAFSKIYNLNFNLGNLKLVIDQKQMPEVKILKTSLDKINLDVNKEVQVIFSIICLKSGVVNLKGISLKNNDDLLVYFINDLVLFVGKEPEHKATAILENTSQIMIDSLI